MPRSVHNWAFRDVECFLKDNDFVLDYSNGSHFYYKKFVNKKLFNVCVPFHGKKSIKPRTLKGIIKQSGIPKEDWFKH